MICNLVGFVGSPFVPAAIWFPIPPYLQTIEADVTDGSAPPS